MFNPILFSIFRLECHPTKADKVDFPFSNPNGLRWNASQKGPTNSHDHQPLPESEKIKLKSKKLQIDIVNCAVIMAHFDSYPPIVGKVHFHNNVAFRCIEWMRPMMDILSSFDFTCQTIAQMGAIFSKQKPFCALRRSEEDVLYCNVANAANQKFVFEMVMMKTN